MSMTHTIAPIPAAARPRAPWSSESVPSMSREALTYRAWHLDTQVSGSGLVVCFDHMDTNGNGTTGSKRLIPGHLDEVST